MTEQDSELYYRTPPDQAAEADTAVAQQLGEQGTAYFTEFPARFEADRAASAENGRATA